MKKRTKLLVKKTFIYISAVIICIYVLLPIYWMVVTAFRPEKEIYEGLIFPREFTLESILAIFGLGEKEVTVGRPITTYLINSIYISTVVMIISTALGSLGGYALARIKFPAKDAFSALSLFTYIFPTIVLMVPLLEIFSIWRLANTHFGLILACLSFTLPYTLWILRGYFQTIPVELEEAAFLDGCGRFQALIRVILPISAPGIAATAIYAFIMTWGNVIFPLILITREDLQVLSIGILMYMKGDFVPWDRLMAASFIAAIPPTILFFLIQRYIVGGLTAGAVKG